MERTQVAQIVNEWIDEHREELVNRLVSLYYIEHEASAVVPPVMRSLPHDFELVNVNECKDVAETVIRDKNSFLAYGGNLKKIENPKSVYPPDYFERQ